MPTEAHSYCYALRSAPCWGSEGTSSIYPKVLPSGIIPSDSLRVTAIIGRVLALTEEEGGVQLGSVRCEFDGRHLDNQFHQILAVARE